MPRLLALLALLAAGPAFAAPLRVGAAVADVTPPDGYPMAGGYYEKPSAGSHDPLFAKALYFEQGDVRFVVVVCDVCGVERGLAKTIRDRVAAATGVPADHVSVSATHTHGGPMHYDPVFIPLFRDAAKAAGRPDLHDLGGYPQKFEDGCVTAARKARDAAKPATLAHGIGRALGVAFNRRYRMKDGSYRTNPGKGNPGIDRAAGPTDDTVPLVLVRDAANGKPFASLCSFAMHVTTYGGATFSADYPGHLQTELRKTYGPDFVSVFAEGCAGDVNQVNTATKEKDATPEQVGAKLAAAVRAVEPKPAAPALAVRTALTQAPLRADRPNDLAAARDSLVGEKSRKVGFLDQVEAYRVLLVNLMRAETGPTRPLLVQAVRLGDGVAVVTLPHEVFVELGLEIKARSPFPTTLVVTIANEVDCYVPTRKAFPEGGYEVTNSPYEPGVGERLVEDAVKLLTELAK